MREQHLEGRSLQRRTDQPVARRDGDGRTWIPLLVSDPIYSLECSGML
jgi:hypothetical protein